MDTATGRSGKYYVRNPWGNNKAFTWGMDKKYTVHNTGHGAKYAWAMYPTKDAYDNQKTLPYYVSENEMLQDCNPLGITHTTLAAEEKTTDSTDMEMTDMEMTDMEMTDMEMTDMEMTDMEMTDLTGDDLK